MDEINNGFDIQTILQILPHRYPMLLVDRVIDHKLGESLHAIKNITINEQIFNGHFPAQAIFPGVLILEAMAQATGLLGYKMLPSDEKSDLYLFAGVDNARFKAQVVPGDVLNLHINYIKQKQGIRKFACQAKVDDKLVCSANLTLARRPAS